MDLYLLLHAAASRAPWDAALPAVVWGRLLGLSGRNVGTIVARQWFWLEEQRLISVWREHRTTRVVLLREDGSGRPYAHPGVGVSGNSPEGDYFRLPHAYWAAGMQDWADTPTKAVLLIALSLDEEFVLPLDHAASWYGMSRDAIRTGLRGLSARGFLRVRLVRKAAPLAALGYTYERRYRLNAPFG